MLDVAIQERIRTNKPLTPAMEEYVKQRNMPKGGDADKTQLLQMQINANKDLAEFNANQAKEDRQLERDKLEWQKKQAENAEKTAKEEKAKADKVAKQGKQLNDAIANRDNLRDMLREAEANDSPNQDNIRKNLNEAEKKVKGLQEKIYAEPEEAPTQEPQQGQPQGVASDQPEPFMPVGMSGGQAPVSEAGPEGPWKKPEGVGETAKGALETLETPDPVVEGIFGKADPTAEDIGKGLPKLMDAKLTPEQFKGIQNYVRAKDRTNPNWADDMGNYSEYVNLLRNAVSPDDFAARAQLYLDRYAAVIDEWNDPTKRVWGVGHSVMPPRGWTPSHWQKRLGPVPEVDFWGSSMFLR